MDANTLDRWQYNEHNGLYYLDGFGIGLEWHEIDADADLEEHEERKRRRIAEANEY